jgi:hypothetical protein
MDICVKKKRGAVLKAGPRFFIAKVAGCGG